MDAIQHLGGWLAGGGWASVAALLFGIFAAYRGLRTGQAQIAFRRSGAFAQATITHAGRFARVRSHSGSTSGRPPKDTVHTLRGTFSTPTQLEVAYAEEFIGFGPGVSEGETVPVCYEPANPASARLATFRAGLLAGLSPIFLVCFGAALVIGGAFGILTTL